MIKEGIISDFRPEKHLAKRDDRHTLLQKRVEVVEVEISNIKRLASQLQNSLTKLESELYMTPVTKNE